MNASWYTTVSGRRRGEEHAEVAVVEREARQFGGGDAEERDDLDHHEAR